jgi:predicted permease
MTWPGHAGIHVGELHADFAAVLAVSAIAALILCGLGLAAYRRRRSRAYLLVTLALAALVARPLVAVLSAAAVVPPDLHHLIEHALDVVVVGLVLGAVYYARTVERRVEEGEA